MEKARNSIRKHTLFMTLFILLAVIMMPGSLLERLGMKTEVQATTTLSNPRIVTDSSMTAGQKVTWDCVWFGTYPQTEIVDEAGKCGTFGCKFQKVSDWEVNVALYNTLKNASDWDSQGEITINKQKYKRIKMADAVYATNAYINYYRWSSSDSYHYFRYEPIKWRILNIDGDNALLLADQVLDNGKYNEKNVAMTWENSSIRHYLNTNFISVAFSNKEQEKILNTNVINEKNDGYNIAAGNNTVDKVYLLSLSEVNDTEQAKKYGFVESNAVYDEARRCSSSTYAKAMGVTNNIYDEYLGNSIWWLRSPGQFTDFAANVDYQGFASYGGRQVKTNYGLRPALNLNLSANSLYSYAGTVCSDGRTEEVEPVIVRDFEISSISLPENMSIDKFEGEKVTITATVSVKLLSPLEKTIDDIEEEVASLIQWQSSDQTVVSVMDTSVMNDMMQIKVSAIIEINSAGISEITASAGEITSQCTVTVHDYLIGNLKQTKFNNPKINIAWDEIYDIDGYFVQYADKASSLSESTQKYETTDPFFASEQMTYGKIYYVRVSAYKNVEGAKKHYSWSRPIAVKILDIWRIQNTDTAENASPPFVPFKPIGNSYYIANDDYLKLISGMSNTDIYQVTFTTRTSDDGKDLMQRYLNIDNKFAAGTSCKAWGGSCYGLSSWTTMVNNNNKNIPEYFEGAFSSLYDINPSNATIQSLVNYYFIQQHFLINKLKIDVFNNSTTWNTKVNTLISKAKNAQNGGIVPLVLFSWSADPLKRDGQPPADPQNTPGHAINAYGIEYGSWTYADLKANGWKRDNFKLDSNLVFTKRIKMYDCSYPKNSNESFDWYITDSGTVYIPGYGLCGPSEEDQSNCTKNIRKLIIIDNMSIINYRDHSDPEFDAALDASYQVLTTDSQASFDISDGVYSCSIENGTVIDSNFEEDINKLDTYAYAVDENMPTEVSFILPRRSKYIINSDEKMQYCLEDKDFLTVANTGVGGTVTFTEKGAVDIKTTSECDITVSMTNNNNIGVKQYPTETVRCTTSSEVSVFQDQNGVEIHSDNLENVTVNGTDFNETLISDISTNAEAIKIEDAGTNLEGIRIAADKDNDGNFDEVLSTVISQYHEHSWNDGVITKKATTTSTGVKTYTCKTCGATKTKTIDKLPQPVNNVITAGNFTKTASSQVQSFTIGAKCKGGAKLSYSSNNANITVSATGKVTVKAKYIGKASITICSTATQAYKATSKTIIVTVNPSVSAITKLKNVSGKKIKVNWKKNIMASGYEIQYSTSSKFAKGNKVKNIKSYKTVSKTISKLSKGKTYYVRIRTYKTVSGKKYYSGWSPMKKIKIKK